MNGDNNKKEFINIAFGFDSNFYRQAGVAIASLLFSSNNEAAYHIYCLCSDDVNEDNKNELIDIVKTNSADSKIFFVEVKDFFDSSFGFRGITKTAYYRLFLHKFLPQIDRIIYSDVDVLFKGNLLEIWDIQLGVNLLGAIKCPKINQKDEFQYHIDRFPYFKENLSNIRGNYFNSGFLLMNLKEIRKANLDDKWLEMSKHEYFYLDQDILNITCQGRVLFLPPKFNVLANLLPSSNYRDLVSENIFKTEDVNEIYNNPVMLHFAGEKPWDNKYLPASNEWWYVCEKNTKFYNYFTMRYQIIDKQREEHKKIILEIREKEEALKLACQDLNKIIQQRDQEIEWMKSSRFWKIKIFYEKFKKPVFKFKRLIKTTLLILKRDGLFIFLKKIYRYTFYRKLKFYKKYTREIINYSKNNNKCEISNFTGLLSIVVLSLNRFEDTKRFISYLYKFLPLKFELILLDNSSDDSVVESLKTLIKGRDNIKLILEKDNLGCAGGRRKAFDSTSGEYVISFDNDIIITPFAVENLLKTMIDNPLVVGACCKTVFPNGKIQFNGGALKIEGDFAKFSLIDEGKDYNDTSTFNQFECDWIPGGATIWKKEILKNFKIDLLMKGSYEDNDYCMMIKKSGYKFFNCPNAIVIHNHLSFNKYAKKDKKYIVNRYNEERIIFAIKTFYKKHGFLIYDPSFYNQVGFDINNSEKIISSFTDSK
jgi:lipopolysaccharide biosynthesis glycosyltransferase/GT2 family glycosyltransferase